jgi:hypothetical protein
MNQENQTTETQMLDSGMQTIETQMLDSGMQTTETQMLDLDIQTPKSPILDSEIKQDKVVVSFIIDSSGSMETMTKTTRNSDGSCTVIKEPVTAINGFIDDYKKKSNLETEFNFTMFDSFVNELPPNSKITNDNYNPAGMTALYDAIGSNIEKLLAKYNSNTSVIIIIITDGEENSSQTFTLKKVKELINKVEKELKWKVIFIGANINVFKEGANMNISRDRTCEYDQQVSGNLNIIMRSASCGVSNFAHEKSLGIDAELSIDVIEHLPTINSDNSIDDCDLPLPIQRS